MKGTDYSKQIKYALIAGIGLSFLAFVLLYLVVISDKNNSYEIEENGQRYGRSEFVK